MDGADQGRTLEDHLTSDERSVSRVLALSNSSSKWKVIDGGSGGRGLAVCTSVPSADSAGGGSGGGDWDPVGNPNGDPAMGTNRPSRVDRSDERFYWNTYVHLCSSMAVHR